MTIKPFEFFRNVVGVAENRGLMFNQPDAAIEIENLHMEKVGEWTAYNQGYARLR